MREIKFRAWDKDYKYMNHKVMVGNVWDEENYHAHMIWVDRKDVDYECESGWMNFDEHSNIEIMQYTGLKDKKGVEIYVGDIVKHFNKKYEVVKHFNGKYVGKRNEFAELDIVIAYTSPECEVIGNIYEKLDVLEGLK